MSGGAGIPDEAVEAAEAKLLELTGIESSQIAYAILVAAAPWLSGRTLESE